MVQFYSDRTSVLGVWGVVCCLFVRLFAWAGVESAPGEEIALQWTLFLVSFLL